MIEDRYFDRASRPIQLLEWAHLMEDAAYKRVADTTIEHGSHEYWISTVWLGLNHRYGPGAPLIFETMVFPRLIQPLRGLATLLGERPSFVDEDAERYSTEADALAGHERMVTKWQKILLDKQDDSRETGA